MLHLLQVYHEAQEQSLMLEANLQSVFVNMAPALIHRTDLIAITRDFTTLPIFHEVTSMVHLIISTRDVPLGDSNPVFNIHTSNLINIEMAHDPPIFGNITQVQSLASIS